MEPAKPCVQLVSSVARSLEFLFRTRIKWRGSIPLALFGKAIRLRKEFCAGLCVAASRNRHDDRDHLGSGPEPRPITPEPSVRDDLAPAPAGK
jgi:hypothetical protein